MGDDWVHLRLCMSCGHVGCCDDSRNRHATRHFHETNHPTSKEGKRCSSIYQLEFDHHYVSIAHGGGNAEANCKLFCRPHNAAHPVEVFGAKYMGNWLPSIN